MLGGLKPKSRKDTEAEEEACPPVDTRQPVDTEAEAEAEAEAAHPLPGCLRKCWT